MKKRPKKYFAFFRHLKEEAADERLVEASRTEIQRICKLTGKPKVVVGSELLDQAFDNLEPTQIRALLHILENDLQVPLHEIVRSLQNGGAK